MTPSSYARRSSTWAGSGEPYRRSAPRRARSSSNASSLAYSAGRGKLGRKYFFSKSNSQRSATVWVSASTSGWSGKSARISCSDFTYDSSPVKRKRFGSSRSLPVPMASSTSWDSASSRRR